MPRRRIDRDAAKLEFLLARQEGLSAREAATVAGVHHATVYRWLHRDAAFDELNRGQSPSGPHDEPVEPPAVRNPVPFRLLHTGTPIVIRPAVDWHPSCPDCDSPAEVRRVSVWRGRWPLPAFWRCSWWPQCLWASWRPRHPEDCPVCQGARLWSHSRRSVSCSKCGVRVRADAAGRR